MQHVVPQKNARGRYFLNSVGASKEDALESDEIAIVATDFHFAKCTDSVRALIDQLTLQNAETQRACEELDDKITVLMNQLDVAQKVAQVQADLYAELLQKFEAFEDAVVPIHDRAVLVMP